jgi:hypothetical protein
MVTRKKYYQEYNQRPEVKARKKEYNQRPEVRKKTLEYMKEYNQRPEAKASNLANSRRPEVIARRMKESKKPEYKAMRKIYMKEYYKDSEVKRKILERHKEYDMGKYMKERRKKDTKFDILIKLRHRLRDALRNYNKNGKTKTSDEYGINYKLIIEHLKPFPRDRFRFHIDHIKPLCSFDLEDPEEIKQAFSPDNHQWLEVKRNLSKGKKITKQE